MVGKTNTPEWGAGSHTFNPVFGATRNPWDTARSAGGSSGGAAVALACRLVPLADGSDLGGSLRNPAAWNGVVGLRPTPGRRPVVAVGAPWLPFSVDGPMARTAADVALLLRPRWPAPTRGRRSRSGRRALDLAGPLDADLRGRRVAWSPSLGGLPVEPAVLAAARGRRSRRLGDLGLDVCEDEPDLAGADRVFETWRAFQFALSLGELYDSDGARMKATMRWNVERGRALTSADLIAATRLHAELCERASRLLRPLRLPGLPGDPGRAVPGRGRVSRPRSPACRWAPTSSGCARARASRVTGCPAISIPAGLTAGRAAGRACSWSPGRSPSGRCSRRPHALDGLTGYSGGSCRRPRWTIGEAAPGRARLVQ